MIDDIIDKLPKKLQIEIIENIARKDLTESEKYKIQKMLKNELSKHTQQGKRTDLQTSSKNLEKVSHGVLEDIGKIFNESHETVRKRLFVSDRIDENPEKYKELKKRLDADKTSLDYAYRHLKKEEFFKEPIPLPKEEHNVIYADPPWEYNLQLSGAPDYPTMKVNEICDLKIPSADDAILFLWTTGPKLEEAFKVIKAWGFTYKTFMIWVKRSHEGKLQRGTGYYVAGVCEILLIAIKGKPGTPLPENMPLGIVEAPRTFHSHKPEIFYDYIKQMYPNRKYLELFARGKPRENWTQWGNELEE